MGDGCLCEDRVGAALGPQRVRGDGQPRGRRERRVPADGPTRKTLPPPPVTDPEDEFERSTIVTLAFGRQSLKSFTLSTWNYDGDRTTKRLRERGRCD